MDIGIVVNTCEPFYRGGYENRAWLLSKALARQGHVVTIFTSCAREQSIDGVRFVPLARQRNYFNARGVRNGWADVLFTLGCLRLLWRRKLPQLLDVYATPFLHVLAIRLVCRLRGIPMLLTAHEALEAGLENYLQERRWKSALARRAGAKFLRLIYCLAMRQLPLVAISETTRRNLEREGRRVAATAPCGIELKDYSAVQRETRPPGAPLRLISVGRLVPLKRIDILLRALALLGEDAARFHLTIVGDGGEATALRRLAQTLKLGPQVEFTGTVSEARKRDLLMHSDVFVLPSLREGFSIATLEAMACGCAILAASPPPPATPSAVVDLVTHEREGLLWDGNAEKLAELLGQILRAPQQLAAWQHNAREKAERYDSSACVKELEAAYALVCNNRGTTPPQQSG